MRSSSFLLLLIGVVLLVILFFLGITYQLAFYLFIILMIVIVVSLFLAASLKKYNQFERAIIFRFGKFNRIGGPGWTIVLPFIEEVYQVVDVRTKMKEFDVTAFTNDDIRLRLEGTMYYTIADPRKAVLNVENYEEGLYDLIQSGVRNSIHAMTMREIFGKLDDLNDLILDETQELADKWGIAINSIQIKSVSPPEEVIQAMQRPEIAANLLQAERFRADARKIVLEAIGEGAKALDDKAVMYLYLQALKQIGESSSSKIVLPMQFFGGGGEGGSAENALLGLSAAAMASLGGPQNVQNAIESIKQKILSSGSNK
jgi:regulator of protease activity HflC (stomatin/prohibitin superfamily)